MTLNNVILVGKDSELQKDLQQKTNNLFSADNLIDLLDIISNTNPELIVFDNSTTTSMVEEFIVYAKTNNLKSLIYKFSNNTENSSVLKRADVKFIKETSELIGAINSDVNKNCTSEVNFFLSDCPESVTIVGKSKAAQKSMRMISLVAKSACNPVLIIGETGTGKELAARAVHDIRHGKKANFVAINCAALTANLLESELFGHAKGSFTSADKEKTGLLELAGEGTVFLDEISEMPLELQAKLLRIIQERTFRKVGGLKDIECKATILASSNRNLLSYVEEGQFRRDLYYRLAICPITLHPLRSFERQQDIKLLAEYFIQNSSICPDKKGKIKGLTKIAAETLEKHSWPGNVRELKNVIERAILLENSDKIGTSNLLLSPEEFVNDNPPSALPNTIKDFSIERAEKELIAKALEEAGWQKTRAASLLGITRATLYAKVKHYNIEEPKKVAAMIA